MGRTRRSLLGAIGGLSGSGLGLLATIGTDDDPTTTPQQRRATPYADRTTDGGYELVHMDLAHDGATTTAIEFKIDANGNARTLEATVMLDLDLWGFSPHGDEYHAEWSTWMPGDEWSRIDTIPVDATNIADWHWAINCL
jgi:hypothetical protein